ncbi:cbb3-type cytochrome oxidase assembly protein CcoS [Luteolibacter sp. AS25]|uniref:cbb3-type cytochrome oxidase assembly protein CcoS n=1 Tax=Luteolibacter sp. AS25 TaxID=3135776 RepID=UPI00398B8484
MLAAVIIILIVMLMGSLGSLFAFSWAANNHQFEDLGNAAEMIFDADEPIGRPTDPSLSEENEL